MNIGFEAKRVFHNKTGLGNYSRDFIRILSTYYPENKYFLYNPKPSKETLFVPNENNVFEKSPSSPFYKKFKNIWRQKGVVNDLAKNNIQLFHGLSGEIPIGLKEKGIKSVVTIHDLIFMRYPHLYSFFDRNIHYYKFKKSTQNADLIIAISEQTKSDIINFLNVDPAKVHVIYQGCNDAFKKTYTDKKKDIIAKKFNLSEQFILNVGTLEERKNALTIVKAIKDLDVNLVLIGKETAYANTIHEYISANNLQNRVRFLKGVTTEELAIIYQLATVFVYPSIFEGFGIPIIEALYSKTPVITNKNGVFPEAGGATSLYIEPFDILDLKNKIYQVIEDDNLSAAMKEKGYEFVQKFNDVDIANRIIDTYLKLVQK
jgi:glycosyltransferase involved in cell wall biosynthesis